MLLGLTTVIKSEKLGNLTDVYNATPVSLNHQAGVTFFVWISVFSHFTNINAYFVFVFNYNFTSLVLSMHVFSLIYFFLLFSIIFYLLYRNYTHFNCIRLALHQRRRLHRNKPTISPVEEEVGYKFINKQKETIADFFFKNISCFNLTNFSFFNYK